MGWSERGDSGIQIGILQFNAARFFAEEIKLIVSREKIHLPLTKKIFFGSKSLQRRGLFQFEAILLILSFSELIVQAWKSLVMSKSKDKLPLQLSLPIIW